MQLSLRCWLKNARTGSDDCCEHVFRIPDGDYVIDTTSFVTSMPEINSLVWRMMDITTAHLGWRQLQIVLPR